jgi:hypothetical protein
MAEAGRHVKLGRADFSVFRAALGRGVYEYPKRHPRRGGIA